MITHFFLKNPHPDKKTVTIPKKILNRFNDYDWPGNVRELFNELRRFIATGRVNLSGHLSTKKMGNAPFASIDDNIPLTSAIEQFEQFYILHILKLHDGHKAKTAEVLKIDRKTLYRKLKKSGSA